MAEIKTKPTKVSVAKYLSSIGNPKRRQECTEIIGMMKAATGDKPVIWGTDIVGFGTVQYKYASGKNVDWLKMGFSNRKAAISLYLMCDLDQVKTLLKKLGKYTRGVGCLYIQTLDDINRTVLKELISTSNKLIKTRQEK
jgi:hypothetical protein